MDNKSNLKELLVSLEKINNGFVIKDFVSFLTWEPNTGALLLPYTGHHSPFCQTIKKNPDAYNKCVKCSQLCQKTCIKKKAPFWETCFLGITEYNVPIIIKNHCVGLISMGSFSPKRKIAEKKIDALSIQYNLNRSLLKRCFDISVASNMPSENSQRVFQFMATFLAQQFEPFASGKSLSELDSLYKGVCFERILNYICLHYTDPNINVNTISKACNYSVSTVSHVFKERMNMNIRSYINRLRIVLAKQELAKGNNISATAMLCGFNDTNYFSNVFRLLVGFPPSQFAKYIHNKQSLDMFNPPMQ